MHFSVSVPKWQNMKVSGQLKYDDFCLFQNHSTIVDDGNMSGNGFVRSMNVKETPHSGMSHVLLNL